MALFQPGQSGNPNGRPVINQVERLFAEQLRIVGKQIIEIDEEGKLRRTNATKKRVS